MNLSNFTEKEIREFIYIVSIGAFVRGSIIESSDGDFREIDQIEQKIWGLLKEAGHDEMFDSFEKDFTLPNDILLKEIDEMREEYEDDVFWFELVSRLGKRDFFGTITEKEKLLIEKKGWLPERVHEEYDRYEVEFETYGLRRLVIDKSK